MTLLKEIYIKQVMPDLMSKFNYKNKHETPRLEKIVVNVGMGEMAHQKELVGLVRDELAAITGQRPLLTKAKRSISNFKIRMGVPVGYKVTLRGERMYDFFSKLVNFVIPRIRDFRGVPRTSFDKRGNYTLGIKEQIIFPELELDKIASVHGMDVTFVTTAKTDKEAMELLEGLGMPFTKK